MNTQIIYDAFICIDLRHCDATLNSDQTSIFRVDRENPIDTLDRNIRSQYQSGISCLGFHASSQPFIFDPLDTAT